MELNVNGNITPQNIKDKLAVILTFSWLTAPSAITN
jgi:hypothetical protein